MTARLLQQSLARIDQQHGKARVGRAGDHVARVLLMPGRIGQDEAAALGFEIAVGDVDGDALLALGSKPIHQQSVIDAVLDRAEPLRIAFQHRHHIVRDGAAFE